MTFYDDGEFAAIEAVRIALGEDVDTPKSAQIHAVTMGMFERHGSDGAAALVIALARHQASALGALADFRGTTPDVVLDEFEHHKLEQINSESGEQR